MVMPDFDLLDEKIAWADAEYRKSLKGQHSEWDQGVWIDPSVFSDTVALNKDPFACGTVCCIAGKTVLDAGLVTFQVDSPNWIRYRVVGGTVEQVAQDILGLTYRESQKIFNQSDTIGDLKRQRDEIAGYWGHPSKYTEEEYREGQESDEYEDDYEYERY